MRKSSADRRTTDAQRERWNSLLTVAELEQLLKCCSSLMVNLLKLPQQRSEDVKRNRRVAVEQRASSDNYLDEDVDALLNWKMLDVTYPR